MSDTDNTEKKRILWVDDYPENNWIEVADFEHTKRISVTEAHNTAVAVEEVKKSGPYDLIISDIGRKECISDPELGAREAEEAKIKPEDRPDAGFQLLDELKELGVETPVIFYTSPFQVTRMKGRAEDRGVIATTASPEELYKAVRKELGLEKIQVAPALTTQLEYLKKLENPQERGRKFEEYLKHMFEEEGLKPRGSFRLSGEEVDGSFEFNNRTFLIEAKWTSQPLSPSDVYMFKGKIDGKMIGTIGVVISWSGYSKSVSDALRVGKELNIILITGEEIEAVAAREIPFHRLLEAKLRLLVETGDVLAENAISLVTGEDKGLEYDIIPQLFVVCETQRDRHLLTAFAERILEETFSYNADKGSDSLSHIVRFVAAGGKMSIPNTVQGLQRYNPRHVIVVADTDGNEDTTREYIKRKAGDLLTKIILVDPQIEWWILDGKERKDLTLMPGVEIESQYRSEGNTGMPGEEWLKEKVEKLDSLPKDETFKTFRCEIEAAMTRESDLSG